MRETAILPQRNDIILYLHVDYVFHAHIGGKAIPPPDRNAAGGLFKKYEIRNQIGKGSFATVHKAIDRKTGKWRAIKIINKARFANNAQTSMTLQREITIMKDLKHPNIVQYVDGCEDQDRLWVVMELVTGGDLLDFVTNKGGLSKLWNFHAENIRVITDLKTDEDEASEIAIMVCEAIAYLHQKGIAHRDLKPEVFACVSHRNKDLIYELICRTCS